MKRKEEKIRFSGKISSGDVIAFGDVHATYQPFKDLMAWVKGSGARLVCLGDLIDRGGEDLKVLELAQTVHTDPESWGLESFSILRGNHEEMFLGACLGSSDSEHLWIQNGGNFQDFQTMRSLYSEWMASFPLFATVGSTLFVHAGLQPGVDPQTSIKLGYASDLCWIREPFLFLGPQLEEWTTTIKEVVHGHTPTAFEWNKLRKYEPFLSGQRVNIDTGCCFKGGFLTAYNSTQKTFQKFEKPHVQTANH